MADIQAVIDVGDDHILSMLVDLVQQDPSFQIAITLNVQGLIVTGMLVSQDAWVKAFTAAASSGGGNGRKLGEAIHEVFMHTELQTADDEDVSYEYLHLIQAYYITGVNRLPVDGMVWRGRIAEVSGWSIGALTIK